MKKARLNRRMFFLRIKAVAIITMIITSSAAILRVMVGTDSEYIADSGPDFQSFPNRPCDVNTILSQAGTWVSFDSAAPGTPAEAHVTISDTTGITIVADFHGFWRSNYTYSATQYDDLEMPGATNLLEPGIPMLPCLFEFVEVPRDVDISIDLLASSHQTINDYNIRPAPPLDIPDPLVENITSPSLYNFTLSLDPVYSVDAFFPGNTTSLTGESDTTEWIMRGHRLLRVGFYPVQFNPISGSLQVYSQMIIKLKYRTPAQIEPLPEALRSITFDNMLTPFVLNYRPCESQTLASPVGTSIYGATSNIIDTGAEYLIITTDDYKLHADRLAEWKTRKGVPTRVETVDKGSEIQVEDIIHEAYTSWSPVPTYALLIGDVEDIPAKYQAINWCGEFVTYQNRYVPGIGWRGYIASDLGYFNIEGAGYLPEMIYGRMSVDTAEQAGIMVDKTIQYEMNPTSNPDFYNDMLFTGYFSDRMDRSGNSLKDGIEDKPYPFTFLLELARHYLKDSYEVYVNYSATYYSYDFDDWDNPDRDILLENLAFDDPLDFEVDGEPIHSYRVLDSISPDFPNFGWIGSYDEPYWYALARANISLSINGGKFLVLYNGHGGSMNMIRYENGEYKRDHVEGWDAPYFDASYVSDLSNGDMLPLVISLACSTGWYDGERDQDHLYLGDNHAYDGHNLFEDYATESFAEEITRRGGGGAVAVIASSRPGYAYCNRYLMDGLIQAFWPGYLQLLSQNYVVDEIWNQPIYDMGTALILGKFYAAKYFSGDWRTFRDETIFHEYQLFGDPETQLWTDSPSVFDVTYPESIGTSNPQSFVVTVRDDVTHEPVSLAKVCIQQDTHIYQVGYTDPKGQIIFDATPMDTSPFLNVTVSKYNYRPHTGLIQVKSSNAKVTLSRYMGSSSDQIDIGVSGFDEMYPVTVNFDSEVVATINPGSQHAWGNVPAGPAGYVNVLATQETCIAVTRFYRLKNGPDPYIYSQYSRNTWDSAGDDRVWDNPCISIYSNGNAVTEMHQGVNYDVKVTVFNRGNVPAVDTKVTLSFAPLGGGLSWTEIGSEYITIDPAGSGEVSFKWMPLLSTAACLNVSLYNEDESLEDRIDNSGLESFCIIPLCSPGSISFSIGNPTNETTYIFIKVKQKDSQASIWNASIVDYSSQAMSSGAQEAVALSVDPGADMEPMDSRLFVVEVYVNCRLLGGMEFTATEAVCVGPCYFMCLLMLFAIPIIAAVAYHKRQEWEANRRHLLHIIILILIILVLECFGIINIIP